MQSIYSPIPWPFHHLPSALQNLDHPIELESSQPQQSEVDWYVCLFFHCIFAISKCHRRKKNLRTQGTKTNSAWHITVSLITKQESRKKKEVHICYKDIKTDKETHGCATNERRNTKWCQIIIHPKSIITRLRAPCHRKHSQASGSLIERSTATSANYSNKIRIWLEQMESISTESESRPIALWKIVHKLMISQCPPLPLILGTA